MTSDLTLRYDRPAGEWTEALPVGNGRLGAMVFGGWPVERLQINESTFWSGGPYDPVNPEALAHLEQVRALIFAGDYAQAEALANRHLMARPLSQMSFQPVVDLWISHKERPSGDYTHSLDLNEAVARSIACGVTTEVIASRVADVLVVSLTAAQPGGLTCTLSLTSPQRASISATETGFLMQGQGPDAHGVKGALTFAVTLHAKIQGGTLDQQGETLRITGATSALIVVDVATSFRRFDDISGDPLAEIALRRPLWQDRDWRSLRAEHVTAHQALFHRQSLRLGPDAPPDLTPTDQRIAAFAAKPDPSLAVLYHQFGRYLMLASSRPGGQPANLQGIWNDQIKPPWDSKFTANINLQMNYWLPNPAGLPECFETLIALVRDLSVTGAAMAKKQYGARGWGMHHNTDLWRATAPIDGAFWGLWPSGGAWLCVQLWDHAVWQGEPDELVREIHPLIEGALRFMLDILVPLPGTDFLVTNPSNSPENRHPFGSSLCAGPAMDRQILRDLINAYGAASDRLGVKGALRDEALAARARLPPDRIGAQGQLQEWLDDWDAAAPERDHRHVSHLYALHPSQQMSPDLTPELARAAQVSLEARGDEATGWGTAWRLNLWARLRDGEHAHKVLAMLLSPARTYPNLFDAHPPFQIDGNFGGAAGILEMLLQSRSGQIDLLPACPALWSEGELIGGRARGGIKVDLHWSGGQVTDVRLTSVKDQRLRLIWPRGEMKVYLTKDQPWVLADANGRSGH
jgi:alpha-L-fucosidase 2